MTIVSVRCSVGAEILAVSAGWVVLGVGAQAEMRSSKGRKRALTLALSHCGGRGDTTVVNLSHRNGRGRRSPQGETGEGRQKLGRIPQRL